MILIDAFLAFLYAATAFAIGDERVQAQPYSSNWPLIPALEDLSDHRLQAVLGAAEDDGFDNLSFVFAAALALQVAFDGRSRHSKQQLILHIVGAWSAEVETGQGWGLLPKLLPSHLPQAISILLVGPDCIGIVPKLPAVNVTLVRSAYTPAVVEAHGAPDVVLFSNADCYTCRWRRTLLFTASMCVPMVFFFRDEGDWSYTACIMETPSSFSNEALQKCDEVLASSYERQVAQAVTDRSYRPDAQELEKVVRAWFRESRPVAGTNETSSVTPMHHRFGFTGTNENWLAYAVDSRGHTERGSVKAHCDDDVEPPPLEL